MCPSSQYPRVGRAVGWVREPVWYQGGYTGWVQGGVIPVHPARCSRRGLGTAKRAPEGLQGLEWVVPRARTRPALRPPLPAVGPASLSQDLPTGNTRLLANKGENSVIFQ